MLKPIAWYSQTRPSLCAPAVIGLVAAMLRLLTVGQIRSSGGT